MFWLRNKENNVQFHTLNWRPSGPYATFRHKDCYNPGIVTDLIDHMLVVLENNEDMGLLDHEDLDHLFIEVSGSGYKAVSASLLWLILYVTSYPDIQTKVSRNRFEPRHVISNNVAF